MTQDTQSKKRNLTPLSEISIQSNITNSAPELESAILGIVLNDRKALNNISGFLKPQHFTNGDNLLIYEAILSMNEQGLPIQKTTVAHYLKNKNVLDLCGGYEYISSLPAQVNYSGDLEYLARIVQQHSIKRSLGTYALDIYKLANDDTISLNDLIQKMEQQAFSITKDYHSGADFETAASVHARLVKEIERRSQLPDGITGISTGFKFLDNLTLGWQSGDFIILAARPGMGKSAWFLSCIEHHVLNKTGAGVISLEMSNLQLMERLISIHDNIESHSLKRGKLSKIEWSQFIKSKMADNGLFFDDLLGSLAELKSKIRRMVQKGAKIIYIDYLQLINLGDGGNKNIEQEVATISRTLKLLAKELKIPIVSLSQLSRKVEDRGDKRPIAADLRYSGALEQDADVILFLYRPEVYKIREINGQSTEGYTELIIEKFRNGPTKSIPIKWNPKFTRFLDYHESEYSKWVEY